MTGIGRPTEKALAITLESAVAVLDPVVALLALVQITGDRTLLHKYGPALDGTQNRTREAFVAITGEVPHADASAALADEVRGLLMMALQRGGAPVLPHLDPALFREMSRLALGLQLPEASMAPAYQHAGFTTDTRVRVPMKVPPAGFKVLVVGAGMMGINAAIKLQQAGFDYRVIEKLDEVGGTWLVNTYPGAAVDTPSRVYSFSFEPNSSWTKYYPTGPEFLSYLKRVVDHYGIRRNIDFGTHIDGAAWDEARKLWVVKGRHGGENVTYEANVLIMAAGPNNAPNYPNVENMDVFTGKIVHGAAWDNNLDLTGKKVVLVGAACSGVQISNAIADKVADLKVIMRQPEYIIPNPQAHDFVDPYEVWAMENVPFIAQWKRLQSLSSSLQDMRGMIMIDDEYREKTGGVSPLNDGIRDMCRNYIKSHFPDDPEMVKLLTPDYPVFAKRPILDCGFYDTLKKPNVHLIKGALASFDETAVILADGTRIECDVVVLATGYQLKWCMQFDIVGRTGKTLAETFSPSPFSYEGMLVPGFPNFFITGGPYSFLVANHAICSEQQVHYEIELLQAMVDEEFSTFEVSEEATKAFVDAMDADLIRTTWVNKGTAHGYYRHQPSGKVILAIPRHNSAIWHILRQPRLEDFVLTKAHLDAAPESLPAPEMVSI